jgi:molybdate transport system ATP-binding protein
MKNRLVFSIKKGKIQHHGKVLFEELDFTIQAGETWALVGSGGAGKTSLLKALAGQLPIIGGNWNPEFYTNYQETPAALENPLFSWRSLVSFLDARHHFTNLSNTSNFYYQQRYNSCDSDDAPTVAEYLELEKRNHYNSIWTIERLVQRCRLEQLLNKQVILLSNGETRRLLLAAALVKQPALLLLDNPLSGLDQSARADFELFLSEIIESGIHVVLSLSPKELPKAVSHVAVLENGKIKSTSSKINFLTSSSAETANYYSFNKLDGWLSKWKNPDFNDILELINGHVQYGNKIILDGINWKIKKAERWSLTGHNGAGKSTLLSLITGDNPQAYSNQIYLFGKKRGSGESIWELKQKIGYASPELFQYFPQDTTVAHAVESGIYDTVGLYRQPSIENAKIVSELMEALGIYQYADCLLRDMATSVQRICLVARALVKFPPLLILDEPCQGLDNNQIEQFRELIDRICEQTSVSLIYVSHYPDEIPKSVTRHMMLEKGKQVSDKC